MSKATTDSAAKRSEGEIIEEAPASLASYLEHWRRYGEKKKGKAREKELDTLLEVARDDLTSADYDMLEKYIAPELVAKRQKSEARAKRGEGLSRSEWRAKKYDEAAAKGIWYPGYPDGCKTCKETGRKHYSGGRCTRCYTLERNERLGITAKRKEKKAEKEKLKEAKMAEFEAKRLAAKLEST